MEKPAPLFIQQHAVGLKRVLDLHSRLRVFFLHLHGAPEKIETHERRLAALPCDRDVGSPMPFDRLADVLLHHLIGHPKGTVGIHLLLLEIKAVGAIEIALGAGRLGHHMKRRERIL